MKIEVENINEIREKFAQLKSKSDLLVLLNLVNKLVYGDEYKRFKIQHINYYSDPRKCHRRYKTFTIKKKSGTNRQINAPVDILKSILKTLNIIIQCVTEPHRLAFGFVCGKSIVDNAKVHLNENYVYNIDIKDFFHSFDRNRVKLMFLQAPFNLIKDREPLAFLLASLCTHPIPIENEVKIVLPQGSPVSPTLTNVICISLDRRLNGLAKKMGSKYSRYADDITFSSNKNIFKDEAFQNELKRIIEEDQKLTINPKKTRLQNTLHRQEVTGLTVNEKVNVQKRYVKQIRMWIYYWERYGYLRAQQIFLRDYMKDREYRKKGIPNLQNVLGGKLDFLKMVKGEKDSTYSNLKNRFDKLKDFSEQKFLHEIIKTWEKEGIEAAMNKYYKISTSKKHNFIKHESNKYTEILPANIESIEFSANEIKKLLFK
jgi:RNA-directed DNA polymerase